MPPANNSSTSAKGNRDFGPRMSRMSSAGALGAGTAAAQGRLVDIAAMSPAAAAAHTRDARLLMCAGSYAASLACFEEPLQGGHVGRIGFELQRVDTLGAKIADHALCAVQRQFVEASPDGGVGGVEFDDLSGL